MTTFEHSSPTEYNGCVLVVDDNDQVRQMLSMALETAGFTVLEASTQLEAQLRLAHTRPDALVLDFQRSATDGLNLLMLVRARHSLANMPVVFLAGTDDEDFRWQVLNTGADWFGLRPIGMIDLGQHVARLIRHGRPAAQNKPLAARSTSAKTPTPIRRLRATA
jgi:DNA-binding response OmpR family regulator